MAMRYRRMRAISRVLPQICSGDNHVQQFRQAINSTASSLIPLPHTRENFNRGREYQVQRYSTLSWKVSNDSLSDADIMSFIESTIDELEGPHHCWFNKSEGNNDLFRRDGTFLVLAAQFIESPQFVGCDSAIFENVKLLQQRYPQLHVIGFQCGCSLHSASCETQLSKLIMKEYITFPLLLSSKNFPTMANGVCYILFKEFRNPVVYHVEGLDLGRLKIAIEGLCAQHSNSSGRLGGLSPSWKKHVEVIKEPNSCSSLRNLLLYFPGCISADETGNRLFLSDSNHHRILVFNDNGKILDCIGSCPGFADGEFESARLLRPAATFYHAVEDCLYIVDSENHAIRRADLETRVLETLYPASSLSKANHNLWTWIKNKLGFRNHVDSKSEEYDSQSLMFPWHLLKSVDNSFLLISHSFQTAWIIDMTSGEIKEVTKGFPKILEMYGQLIMEKISLLKHMPHDWLQQQTDAICSPEGLPYASLMSSLTNFQNYVILCDTVGQRILKVSRDSGVFSTLQFSNFGILGLPYWSSISLERVYALANGSWGVWSDHLQYFSLLPGRVDIKIHVAIPETMELVEPLPEGCIWRQARGAACDVSEIEGVEESEKVGVAQQWYDELDNLAFSAPELESTVEEHNTSRDIKYRNKNVYIDCAVNTSPGTSEVIICAALYLRLRNTQDSHEGNAAMIADLLHPESSGRDSCIQLLLSLHRDLREVVFVKPLHVRIKLDTLSYPKADNSKDIILTDSSIEINVSLNQ